MTKEQFEFITTWQDQVFTKATPLSAIKHLQTEVRELLNDVETNSDGKRMEFADCFLLLFGAAHLDGMDYFDICKAIQDKMEINLKRKWGEVNKDGFVEHID